MAREPAAGRVKRRLAACVGEGEALRVHVRLLSDTLRRLDRLQGVDRVIALACQERAATGGTALDGTARERLAGALRAAGGDDAPPTSAWRLLPQRGDGLGRRLAGVFDELFAEGCDAVAIVDSDSPALPLEYVREALLRAAGGELALGPAADGGYYLIACGRAVWLAAHDRLAAALAAAPMGASQTFAATSAALMDAGARVGVLPLWIDVDEAGDLPVMERLLADDDEALRGLPLTGLREVYLHVTNRCATGCPHCYNESGPRSDDELTTDEWREVVDECAALGATSFVILGGDPLLRDDLAALIEHITGVRGAKARFFFNGTIDEPTAAALAAAGHGRLCPLVSIDGTREANDALRGPGNFDRALRSVVNLRSVGLEPVANAVALRPVLPTLPGLAGVLGEAGVGRLHLIFPHQRGALDRHLDLVPTGAEMLVAVRALDAACAAAGVVFDNLLAWRRRLGGRQDLCTAGCRDIAVDPYGDVYACTITCGDPAFVAGSVREERLETIWRESPALRLLRAARARDRAECAACAVVDACGGECWVQAHYAARARGRRAGYAAPFPYCDLVRPVFAEMAVERIAAAGAAAGCEEGACGGQAAAGETDFTLFDCI